MEARLKVRLSQCVGLAGATCTQVVLVPLAVSLHTGPGPLVWAVINMIVLVTGQQESGSGSRLLPLPLSCRETTQCSHDTRTLLHARGSPPPFRSL